MSEELFMNELEKRNKFITQIVSSLIMIAVGIAFCFSIPDAAHLISIVLGIVVIVSGAILLAVTIAVHRITITIHGLVGALLIALGVFSIINNPVELVVRFVPFTLMSFGGILIVDAFLRFFWKKKSSTFFFVMTLLGGTIIVALGICFLVFKEFAKFAGIVLGVTLIVYGITNFIMAMVKNKKEEKIANEKLKKETGKE